MIELPEDYRDLLIELADAGADFVVVGGHAVAFHGHPRATKDLDVLVRGSRPNAQRVYRALAAFGAPLEASRPGWGHDLEYCLQFDKAHPDAAHSVLAVRSPGRDGKFSPGPYQTGSFAPSDVDQDTVWMNGYFVRWPERREAGK